MDIHRCSSKYLLLKSSQISQESTCVEIFVNNVTGHQNWNFIKETPTEVFTCEICKSFKSTLSYRISPVAASGSFRSHPAALLKKKLRKIWFSVNFAKFLRTSFLLTEHHRMTASCVYLLILRSFLERFFHRAPLGNCYFMSKLQNFNHQIQ